MIARGDYAGPITKAAEAMFARAERHARRSSPEGASAAPRRRARPLSPLHLAVRRLGLSLTTVRHWEDAGVIGFERSAGRRVIDEAALERLRTVAQLRRAGFTIKEIAWIADTLPPTVPQMRQALQARLDHRAAARAATIARAIIAGAARA